MGIKKKVALVTIFLGLLIVISACSTKYVCFDGSIQKISEKCPKYPVPAKIERDARLSVENFGNSYALAKGDRFTMVNLFASQGDWYADTLFFNQKTSEVNHVKFFINGSTTSVECIEGCDYIGMENITNSLST